MQENEKKHLLDFHLRERAYRELLFEGKNKKYGAFEIRRIYARHVILGMVLSISLLTLALTGPYLVSLLRPGPVLSAEDMRVVEVMNMPPPPGALNPEYAPPLEVEPVNLPPRVVKEIVPEKKPVEPIDKKEESTDDKDSDSNGSGDAKEGEGEGSDNDQVYVVVDELPKPPGGSLASYLARHLKYPEQEKIQNRQGKVWITCIVNKDGSLSDIRLMNGVSPGLDNEALRVVKSMPQWTPAKRGGEPVRMIVKIPINFSLRK